MRTWLAGIPLFLSFSASAEANLHAWTQRIGTGLLDEAGTLTGDRNSVFATTRSGGLMSVAKLNTANGQLLWMRTLGAGQPVALAKDESGFVVLIANEKDAGGKDHAVTFALDANTGATRWTVRGFGTPDAIESRATALQVSQNVYVGGMQDGEAKLMVLNGFVGTRVATRTLPGEAVASLEGKRGLAQTFGWVAFATHGAGNVWYGRAAANGVLGFVARAEGFPAGSRLENPQVNFPSWDRIWIAGDLIRNGNSDAFAMGVDGPSQVVFHRSTFGSTGNDRVLDVTGGNATSVRALVGSTDGAGRVTTVERRFGASPLSTPTVFLAKQYAGPNPVGTAYLANRGWDLALRTDAGLVAVDGGLLSDDVLSDAFQWGDIFAYVTSYRLGRSQARLIRLQTVELYDAARALGQGNDLGLRLSGVAPAAGYDLRLSVPATSALRVPAALRVPGGVSEVALPVTRYALTEPTSVPMTMTSQGRTWTTVVNLQPTKLAQFAMSPASAVGCTTLRGRFALNGPAPHGGLRIRLALSSPSADGPAEVIVPEGKWTADFDVCTFAVRSTTSVTLSAMTSFGTVQTRITVLKPELSSVRFEAPTVRSGGSICAIVKITGPAPTGGLDLTTTCSGALRNPGGARVPYSCVEQQVPLTALNVTVPTRSTVTVGLSGRTLTSSVIVVP